MRSLTGECLNSMPLAGLDREVDAQSFLLQQFRLPLNGREPLHISFADMHVNAQGIQSIHLGLVFVG